MVLDGPHPGATINIQVGSSLTKGGGGQTKNLGKLVAWLNISNCTNLFTSWTPNPAVGDNSCNVMENIGQMRNRLDSSAHQVAVLTRSWCESGLPLERRFKHLRLQLGFCRLGPMPAFRQHRNSGNCSCVHRLHKHGSSHSFTDWPPSSLVRTWLLSASGSLKVENKRFRDICNRWFSKTKSGQPSVMSTEVTWFLLTPVDRSPCHMCVTLSSHHLDSMEGNAQWRKQWN